MLSNTRHDKTLGRCPECEATITTTRVIIEYETDDGTKAYAECPDCLDVVHPA